MSKQKQIVISVSINNDEGQKKIMSEVGKIKGIQSITVSIEKKTVTVVGSVEPVPIFKALQKIRMNPEIVTVGPSKPKCSNCQYLQNVCTCGMGTTSYNYEYPAQSVYDPRYYPPQPYSSSYYGPGTREYELVGVEYPPRSAYESPGSCTIL